MQLRDYQIEAIRGVYGALKSGSKRVLLQMPTGAGKTQTFCKVIEDFRARRPDEKVLAVAHRVELIDQMHKRLGSIGVSNWPIIAGGVRNPDYPVQCASIQTVAHPKFDAWPDNVGLIVVDEAHHFTGVNSYNLLLDRYPDATLLGVTATPCRLDGKGFDGIFERLILGPTVKGLMGGGYLSPYRYFVGSKPNLDGVAIRHGDYQIGQLAERMSTQEVVGDVVAAYLEHCPGKRCITFAVNVDHSMKIVERYTAAGIPAEHVDGKTPTNHRKAILNRFKSGETLVLSNVGIITEGFDCPEADAVQLARPTKSLSLYLQMVGRCLRYFPGKTAIILDHGQNYKEHGLPCDDRKWTLEGAPKKPARYHESSTGEVEPETEEEKQKREIEEIRDAEMVEISQSRIDRVMEIVQTQQSRGYKAMWAFFRVKDTFGRDLQLNDLQLLGKQLGYHWKWAQRKWEEHQEEMALMFAPPSEGCELNDYEEAKSIAEWGLEHPDVREDAIATLKEYDPRIVELVKSKLRPEEARELQLI